MSSGSSVKDNTRRVKHSEIHAAYTGPLKTWHSHRMAQPIFQGESERTRSDLGHGTTKQGN